MKRPPCVVSWLGLLLLVASAPSADAQKEKLQVVYVSIGGTSVVQRQL